MADCTFPPDLVQLQARFFALDAEAERLAAVLPSGIAVLAGEAERDVAGEQALNAVREERGQVVLDLNRHPFWRTVDNRFNAGMALRKAVQT
jgi:hypothetical protein